VLFQAAEYYAKFNVGEWEGACDFVADSATVGLLSAAFKYKRV